MILPSNLPEKTNRSVLQSEPECCILKSACILESIKINHLGQNAECNAQTAEFSAFWIYLFKNNKLKEFQNVLQTPTPYGGSSEPHAYAGGSLPALCIPTKSSSQRTQSLKDGHHE